MHEEAYIGALFNNIDCFPKLLIAYVIFSF